ncbi:MAG: N(5)-(carboxyethyl)ornithine synthase [Massilia sp.]
MKTVGLMISTKENEKRRAMLPKHVARIKNRDMLYFETGYGESFGHADDEYRQAGAHVVSRDEALGNDIIVDPKIGDATYLSELRGGQTVFGWVHAVQNRSITDKIVSKEITAVAWEDMFEGGRHVFWRSNELAGEAAIMHAFTLYGKLVYECNVALIGRGNVARGAYRILSCMGAKINSYERRTESLLRNELHNYDVVVNGVLWDVYRKDHIIYREDLKKLRNPAMIVDISCDRAGGIETSRPTTIEDPVYSVDGVLHYVVDHTPALIGYSVTDCLGEQMVKYLDVLIEERAEQDEVLRPAICIRNGAIIDQRINDFQKR